MKKTKKGWWLLLVSFGILSLSCSPQPAKNRVAENTAVSFPAQARGDDENYLNTVTATGPDGVKYKLVQIGDRLPKLYLNNKLVPAENLGRYATLISQLTPVLWHRQKEAAKQIEGNTAEKQVAIVNDLVKEGIIRTEKELLSFRLTANEFVVNGKNQSFTIFSRFMNKYIGSGDEVYQFNHSSK